MHNSLDLISTLTGGLAAALTMGYVTHRIGLSPIVGYLLAGFLVGPNTPGFVANSELAEQLAEIGVILLMFGVGLHFHLSDLLAVRRIAVPGAIGQSLVATLLGLVASLWLGFSLGTGIVFGLAISVASTVVLMRVLADNNEMHTRVGHIAVGWLIVEDLFTVVVLVMLPAIYGENAGGTSAVLLGLLFAFIKISVLIGMTFVIGDRVIPAILGKIAATRSRELFTLSVLVMALGIAVGSARLFGVSMALGAFLAGMIVGRSEFSLRAATDALPMRDAFAVLFFVSIGMLFDPAAIVASPWIALVTLAIVVIGKPLAAVGIVLFLGYPVRVAFAVALALAQIGEFSFILGAVGMELKIFNQQAMNALVAAAIATISVNPLLYKLVGPLEAYAMRWPRLWRWLNSRVVVPPESASPISSTEPTTTPRHRAVVAGYGPVGRTICRLLRQFEIEPCVIELNLETVRLLRKEGIDAVYGDIIHMDTLRNAGVDRAGTLILSAAGIAGTEELIRNARELNPGIQILVRSTYLRDVAPLLKAGASRVFSGEGEVALAMALAMLRELGATPDQIDREQDRVHAEIFTAIDTAKPQPAANG